VKKEKEIMNLPASVRQRLINLCGKSGIEFQNISLLLLIVRLVLSKNPIQQGLKPLNNQQLTTNN